MPKGCVAAVLRRRSLPVPGDGERGVQLLLFRRERCVRHCIREEKVKEREERGEGIQ